MITDKVDDKRDSFYCFLDVVSEVDGCILATAMKITMYSIY